MIQAREAMDKVSYVYSASAHRAMVFCLTPLVLCRRMALVP
jgi:hypothetical protein